MEDVIAHQADLRFLLMQGKKLTEAQQEFDRDLRHFRRKLDPASASADAAVEGATKTQLQRYSDRYQRLRAEGDRMTSLLGDAVEKEKEYRDATGRLQSWLHDTETTLNDWRVSPQPASREQLQQRLAAGQQLAVEAQAQQKALQTLRRASDELVQAMQELDADQTQVATILCDADEIAERVRNVQAEVGEQVRTLTQEQERSQGARDGVDGLLAWLDSAEDRLNRRRPVVLSATQIEDELVECDTLLRDMDAKTVALASVAQTSSPFSDRDKLASTLAAAEERMAGARSVAEERRDTKYRSAAALPGSAAPASARVGRRRRARPRHLRPHCRLRV